MWLPAWNNSQNPKRMKKGATLIFSRIRRKKARGGFEQVVGREESVNRMYEIIRVGKQGLDRKIN
jgi:hypothetical protein